LDTYDFIFNYFILGVYISETAHPKLRGSLTICPSLFMALGMLIVWTAGYFLTWWATALVNLIPTILLFMVMLVLPESPYWLVEDNNYSNAR
jgi:fatty acid desaturase